VNDIHRQTILAKAEEENLPERIVTGDTLKRQLAGKTVCDWGTDLCFEPDSVFKFSNARQPVFNKKFDLLGENLEEHQNNGYEVFILSNQEKQTERLQAIFRDIKATVHFKPVNFTLHEGFVDHDLKICCYTDHQIFERYHRFKLKTRKAQREAISMKELNMLASRRLRGAHRPRHRKICRAGSNRN
jgi:transcription-repair coupling factor (superfamily II helicase)